MWEPVKHDGYFNTRNNIHFHPILQQSEMGLSLECFDLAAEMLNIPRMKLALPKWIWPDVQRLITSANSVVFKSVLAQECCMCVCVCGHMFYSTHRGLPEFQSWLNIYNRERHQVSQTNTHTHTLRGRH